MALRRRLAAACTAVVMTALLPFSAAAAPGERDGAPAAGTDATGGAGAGSGAGTDTPGRGPVVRPVPGAVVEDFQAPASDYGPGHRGVDLEAGAGDEVLAALDGVVSFAGPVAGTTYVTVDHDGGLSTTYGDLTDLRVAEGDEVAAGEVLGVLAGTATALDWGARLDGGYVDPLSLLSPLRVHLVDPARLVDPVAPPVGMPPPTADGGWVWPAAGRITSGFGYRVHPISGDRRLHAGADIAAPTGAPIVAANAGTVAVAGPAGGYGLAVYLDHGGIVTRYGHASAVLVRAGQRVERGQLIARVGSTGRSTGPHLHFEVRPGGAPVDPVAFYASQR